MPPAGVGPDQHLAPQRGAGSWASASRVASIWSAAVFDRRFPVRSTMASGSPFPPAPWSAKAVIGMKAERLLPGQRRRFMRDHDSGVQVDGDQPAVRAATVRVILARHNGTALAMVSTEPAPPPPSWSSGTPPAGPSSCAAP